MPRQKQMIEGFLAEDDATKIRKRGCSPSSPSSSIVHNYRFKKAVLVGKRGGGSSTPVPSWRLAASRSPSISLRIAAAAAAETPRSQIGRSTAGRDTQPVSARKLAATLWGMNEMPAPAAEDRRRRRGERTRKTADSLSGALPRHLTDPSHSPVSERSDRSGKGTHRRRQSSSSQSRRLGINYRDVGPLDSVSNASFMEVETRSRCQTQTPAGSTVGSKNRLKDVSNALTTSKELLKIISRMWGQENYQPSTSMSLMSALHAELERARLQINQLAQDQRSDQSEVNCLLKCFAEEKAAWKTKEEEAIQSAIESIAGELEAERKLQRRIETLNKKLGKELAETKALFSNALKMVKSSETEDELDAFLRNERGKERAHHASFNHARFGFIESDEEEVEDSGESDLRSIELNTNFKSKGHKPKMLVDEELKGQRRSASLLRSVSNMTEGYETLDEFERHRRSCGDEVQRNKPGKGHRNHVLSSSRLGPSQDAPSPSRQTWFRDLEGSRLDIPSPARQTWLRDLEGSRFDDKYARRSRR